LPRRGGDLASNHKRLDEATALAAEVEAGAAASVFRFGSDITIPSRYVAGPKFTTLIDQAAHKRGMKPSKYVRQAQTRH
jgi:hypothetical protein